jgi:hypothetical protein
MMLYSKLLWFSGEIGTGAGDIRNTEDFGPTSQQLEVYEILRKRLAEIRDEYDRLFNVDVPAFNNKLKDAGLANLITNLDVRSAPPDESMFRRR